MWKVFSFSISVLKRKQRTWTPIIFQAFWALIKSPNSNIAIINNSWSVQWIHPGLIHLPAPGQGHAKYCFSYLVMCQSLLLTLFWLEKEDGAIVEAWRKEEWWVLVSLPFCLGGRKRHGHKWQMNVSTLVPLHHMTQVTASVNLMSGLGVTIQQLSIDHVHNYSLQNIYSIWICHQTVNG